MYATDFATEIFYADNKAVGMANVSFALSPDAWYEFENSPLYRELKAFVATCQYETPEKSMSTHVPERKQETLALSEPPAHLGFFA